jgi:hypothetical protein
MGFIFGGNTGAPTVEALRKRREIANLLAQQATSGTPGNMGEGINAIGSALISRYMDSKLGPQEDAAGQAAMQQLMQIKGGLGPEGISQGDFEGLSGVAGNPYAAPGVEGMAKALMRRQITPEAGGFTGAGMQGGTGSNMLAGGAGNDRFQGTMGGPMGWADPGEEPLVTPEIEELQRQFEASPTDMNGMLLEKALRGQQGLPQADPRDIMGMMSGSGKQLASAGPMAAGPQVAQADTGTQSDARGMKLTEGQSKDLGFWNRMDAVTSKIDERSSALTDRGDQIKGAVPMFGNSLVSEDYQRGKRDADEWITALLRKDTGATVTPQEWSLYGPIYIPQPGDSAGTLADKAEARKRAAEGMKAGLGTAEVLANELLAARQAKAPPAAAGGDDWRSKDPSTWTDEQLKEYNGD